MTEPISAVCEHCDARLKLKNPDVEGKKIKCPKCGEAFVVKVAGAPAAAVKKPVRKKPSDDDESFLDDEPEDYDDDVEDYDDEPRRRNARASRGGKKRNRRRNHVGRAMREKSSRSWRFPCWCSWCWAVPAME